MRNSIKSFPVGKNKTEKNPTILVQRRFKYFQVVTHVFLVSIILFNMGSVLLRNKGKYMANDYWQRYPQLKNIYYNSIYANKNGGWFPDETIYAYNGGALVTGTSPILVNPEIPPVGKYLIGLSALIFGNEHLVVYLFGIAGLVMMYLIGRQIFGPSPLALVAPALVTFEPLFINQFSYTPLLDIFQLFFLLVGFYFFNKAFLTRKRICLWFLLTSVSTGLFISTKFFGTGITVIAAFITVLILNGQYLNILKLIVTLPISVIILLVSYIRVLIIGYPIMKFLGIQKWVWWYNQGHIRGLFTVWPLLIVNKWYQEGKIISDPQWRISWPVMTVLSALVMFIRLKDKVTGTKAIEVLIAWVIYYLGILSLSDASARYFVILLPVLYMIGVWVIYAIFISNLNVIFRKKFIKIIRTD